MTTLPKAQGVNLQDALTTQVKATPTVTAWAGPLLSIIVYYLAVAVAQFSWFEGQRDGMLSLAHDICTSTGLGTGLLGTAGMIMRSLKITDAKIDTHKANQAASLAPVTTPDAPTPAPAPQNAPEATAEGVAGQMDGDDLPDDDGTPSE